MLYNQRYVCTIYMYIKCINTANNNIGCCEVTVVSLAIKRNDFRIESSELPVGICNMCVEKNCRVLFRHSLLTLYILNLV